GCVIRRLLHLSTCPVGLASQNQLVRKKSAGDPDHVVNFMRFIATEVREWMAQLGFRTVEEMVGHSERLETAEAVDHYKAQGLDFAPIFYQPPVAPTVGRSCKQAQDHGLQHSLDRT